MHPRRRVLVYSNNAHTRERIRLALRMSIDRSSTPVDFIEVATADAAVQRVSSGGIDMAVLDAEASPAGGLGLAKQLKDELQQCPPIAVIIARDDDAWLAKWSRADVVVSQPIDPVVLTQAIVPMLDGRLTLTD
ncbi:MAG: hypothetical protein E6Q98_23380 [Rhodospirillaceae bacterium]|nr:MAG: hypothetical protein E6Q98_23380 [Rhodospirillaceae bacterium]